MIESEARVVAVCFDEGHHFSKNPSKEIVLLPGLGVQGDAHLGVTVQHRSRVAADPTQPNLRQVHLIHTELDTWSWVRSRHLGRVGPCAAGYSGWRPQPR